MAEASRYDFDAPSHAVDFMELVNAETDDGWFDQNALQSTPSNLVKSWSNEAQRGAKRTTSENAAQPQRVSKRKVGSGSGAPPTKRLKEIPVPLKPQAGVRRSKRLQSTQNPSSKPAEPVSSEQLELERIRNLQEEVALHRRQNEASFRAALAGNPPPKKLVLSTTVPEEFHFSTDTRVRASTPSTSSQREVDFVNQLRKPSTPVKARKGATIPKPFNLSAGHRKGEEPGDYVPMAQQIQQFQKKTPARYHLHSRRTQDRGPSPVRGQQLKLTQPRTPQLMTRKRGRPAVVKSSAELEEEELQQLQKSKVKPLELNRKILESAEELKKPAVKEPTVPEEFQLEIEKRLQERQTTRKSQEDQEKHHTFRAKPLPKKVLEGVVGLPEKKVPLPTVPESPAFALKNRVRLERKSEEVKPPSPVKAQPVPHFGIPFQPRLLDHHQVEVCPFSFEQRDKERQALKEKKLEEQRNEEVPQFKAQLLPDFSTVVLPEKKKLEPTKPEPFKLLIDERGAVKTTRWEETVKKEQKLQEEAATFKARPNVVTHKEPFRPQKESRPPVVVEPFQLATERRAKEWQEFEQLKAEKEVLRVRMEEQQRREEELREREEIARLRQEQVHKARPIRQYKPVELKKSELPLTVPQTPKFSDRFRF